MEDPDSEEMCVSRECTEEELLNFQESNNMQDKEEDNKNHVGKYTSEELQKLKELRSVYGNNWQAIGAAMGRSASSLQDRCRFIKDNCNQGKWLPAEEEHLCKAVYDLANALPGEMISSGLSWAVVADRVGTRSDRQCQQKWRNYLNRKVAGGTDWTREDDATVTAATQALPPPVEIVNSPAALTSVPVGSVLQTAVPPNQIVIQTITKIPKEPPAWVEPSTSTPAANTAAKWNAGYDFGWADNFGNLIGNERLIGSAPEDCFSLDPNCYCPVCKNARC